MAGSERRGRLLVGIDPGATTGLAILTLSADPLLVKSFRDASRELLVNEIHERGEPVLFATDVTPAPASIVKLASLFDSPLYQPNKSLSHQEKRRMVQEYLSTRHIKPLDDHSHDALAAALKAYKNYENKFAKVEARIEKLNTSYFKDELKAALIRGMTLSKTLKNGIVKTSSQPPMKPLTTLSAEYLKKEVKELREALGDKERRVERLVRERGGLLRKVQELEGRITQLSLTLEKVKAERFNEERKRRLYLDQRREIERLRENLRSAEQKIESLVHRIKHVKNLRESGRCGDLILLKTIRSFTRRGIEEAIAEMNIREGDPLLISDASGGGKSTANMLADLHPRFIIIQNKMSHQAEEVLRERGVKIWDSKNIPLHEVEGIPAVKIKDGSIE